ncbi:glutathione S-transferase omega-1-like [Littorina saxatilis]|uniref:Glutathione S-transferase omega n=1 Tax=Littorina saxatilis TaxID=31220 RepID=A0AAN9BW51_9CAEN
MTSEHAYRTGSAFPPLATGKLRLYSMRFCPFAQRARLILELKGISYQTINVSLTEKPDWFLEKNPNGQVPVLEQDGRIVYESLVVADYLDSVHPDPRVTPADPYCKARDAMLIEYYGNKYVSSYYKIVFSEGKDTDSARVANAALQRLEDELSQRKSPYFGGEKAAFIDYMIWPWLERLPVLTQYNSDVNMTSFPLVRQWREEMLRLPEVQKCLFSTDHHVEFYAKWRGGDQTAFDIGLSSGA